MRKLFYFIKGVKFDILSCVSSIALVVIAFMYWQNQLTLLLTSILCVLIFLIVFLYLRIRERDFYFNPLNNRKDKDDWIGNGIFEYSRTNKSFEITSADPGYLYSKCLTWSDYKFEFDFKIVNSCLGAIVRAVNLSNYIMFQINTKGIRPHVRINGSWSVWEASQVNLEFLPNGLSLDMWYRAQIFCDKDVIYIKIFSEKKKILDRHWKIPRGAVVFSFKREEKDPKPVNIPFPINLEYGTIGFRNSGDEKALIKNVLIEKII